MRGWQEPTFLWDAAALGLGLRATANGAKSYMFQAKLNGQAMRITIGAPGTWTIQDAQAEARRLKVIIDTGQGPRQMKADGLDAEQDARDAKQAAEVAQAQQEAIEQAKRELIARVAWDAYLAHPRPAAGKNAWGAQHRSDHINSANPGGNPCKIGDKKSTCFGALAAHGDWKFWRLQAACRWCVGVAHRPRARISGVLRTCRWKADAVAYRRRQAQAAGRYQHGDGVLG